MTDIWDELWRRWDKGEVDPFALVTCFPDFIKKIRAEGNRLKEKADAMLRFRKAAEDLGEYAAHLNGKLEAVRTHLDTIVIPSVSDITYLKNLLEAEAKQ